MIARAAAAGIETILVPGVDLAQWERASLLSSAASVRLRFAVGVHPQVVDEHGREGTARALAALEAWVERLGAVAIGELGWDKAQSPASLERQAEVADAQIELARARGMPVILHVLGAHGLALERLARHGRVEGVVHSFSGAPDLVSEYVRRGLAISFGPSVTRPSAKKPLEAARRVPLDRLLVETDGPDQFVFGAERRRGEPADVVRVIEAVAKARGESVETVARAATENARRLFG